MKPSDLPSEWRDLMKLEKDAAAIANFEPMVVPGLLQTAEYAAAMIRGINADLPDREVNAMVATRMARQSLLSTRDAPTLHAIVDEMVLRRPIGDVGVMHRQLQHLLACAQRPNVTLQVIPISAGATAALEGPIVIIDLTDGRSVIHLETRRAGGFLSEEPDPTRAVWRKSGFSTTASNCVEVALAEPELVSVRDSKNTAGPTLAVPTATWQRFLANV